MNKANAWIRVREAAERWGKTEPTIRSWIKKGHVRSEKRDRRVFLNIQDAEAFMDATHEAGKAGKKPAPKTSPTKRVVEEEMTVSEFARRAGIAQRTAQLKRQRGEIHRYTETELRNLQEGVTEQGQTGDTVNELKRQKLMHEARLARIKADREEGTVYDAEAAQSVLRRLAHLAQSGWRQAPMLLPQLLAGKSKAEMRNIISEYAHTQMEDLKNVENI